jgi:hypothetical protein
MRALAITSVKNEGAFLLEWIAHHQAVGFSDFLIFSNDCDDGTDLILDRLETMGVIVHVRNPGPYPQGPQWAALKAADQHPLTAAADWILFFDIDEFVNIHVGDKTLTALLGALPQATAIPLTWRMFGNAGKIEFSDTLITHSFTRAAPATLGWPWRAQMFKTLLRNDNSYAKLGVHRPKQPDPARPAKWFDGSGRPLADAIQTKGIFSDYTRDNYRLVQLNHYALGAMESYVLKIERGRSNRDVSGFDMGYWVERNLCEVEDLTIQSLDIKHWLDHLHADATLCALHHDAVKWRKHRFAALMQHEAWRAIFGRLLMTPPSLALSPAQAQLIYRHITSPQMGADGA